MSEPSTRDRAPAPGGGTDPETDGGAERAPQDRNEDAQTLGGALGAATGGAMVGGLALGPLGALGGLIGALAGVVGGWWAGEELVSAVRDVDSADNRLRHAHEHAGAERPYDEVRHAYQLGYLAAQNPRYAHRDFAEVARDLETAWTHAHQHEDEPVAWDDVRTPARVGYDVGRRRA
jgi:hypothetical protein